MTARRPAPGADAVGVKSGKRRAASWTQVHDWVTFSTVSPEAKALYAVMRAHIYRDSEDDVVWTSTLALALILGYSRGDKIKKFMDELVALKAVTRVRGGIHGVNVYDVEQEPPVDYRGPRGSKDWHAMNGPKLEELRAAEKTARDARRATKKRSAPAETPRNSSSAPVHPDRGEQGGGAPVTPDRGEHVAPDRGEVVHPDSGREPPLGLEVVAKGTEDASPSSNTCADRREPPPASPEQSREGKSSIEGGEDQEIDETAESVKSDDHWPTLTAWELDLYRECRKVDPTWDRMLRKVLGSRRIRAITARDPDLVREAFMAGACDPGTVPMRMWHVNGCPHWRDAAARIQAEAEEGRAQPEADTGQCRTAGAGEVAGGPPGQRTVPPAQVAALFAERGLLAGPARTAVRT